MGGRFIVVLLVIATLLPWRLALACTHEAAVIQQRCCCHEMRRACPHVETGVGPCCSAVVAAPGQIADSESDALPSPDGGKPLPAPPSILAFDPPPPRADRLPALFALDSNWPTGSQTWLHTARLRL